jgi:hypothetical protein
VEANRVCKQFMELQAREVNFHQQVVGDTPPCRKLLLPIGEVMIVKMWAWSLALGALRMR